MSATLPVVAPAVAPTVAPTVAALPAPLPHSDCLFSPCDRCENIMSLNVRSLFGPLDPHAIEIVEKSTCTCGKNLSLSDGYGN